MQYLCQRGKNAFLVQLGKKCKISLLRFMKKLDDVLRIL